MLDRRESASAMPGAHSRRAPHILPGHPRFTPHNDSSHQGNSQVSGRNPPVVPAPRALTSRACPGPHPFARPTRHKTARGSSDGAGAPRRLSSVRGRGCNPDIRRFKGWPRVRCDALGFPIEDRRCVDSDDPQQRTPRWPHNPIP